MPQTGAAVVVVGAQVVVVLVVVLVVGEHGIAAVSQSVSPSKGGSHGHPQNEGQLVRRNDQNPSSSVPVPVPNPDPTDHRNQQLPVQAVGAEVVVVTTVVSEMHAVYVTEQGEPGALGTGQ